jgi:hypothetical protein
MKNQIVENVKPCCIFSYADAPTAIKHFEYEVLENFGKIVCNEDGTIKHYTYIWDRGGRSAVRCKKCGAVFLYQWTEFDGYYLGKSDEYYENYFLVKDLDEAILLNNNYSGFKLEMGFKGLKVWTIDDVWHWNKEDTK